MLLCLHIFLYLQEHVIVTSSEPQKKKSKEYRRKSFLLSVENLYWEICMHFVGFAVLVEKSTKVLFPVSAILKGKNNALVVQEKKYYLVLHIHTFSMVIRGCTFSEMYRKTKWWPFYGVLGEFYKTRLYCFRYSMLLKDKRASGHQLLPKAFAKMSLIQEIK